MCVAITLKPGAELTVDEVYKMHRNNADGMGVAWVKDGLVSWWKTLRVDPEYVTKAINVWKDSPRLVHFRFATAGGAIATLCHPFEVGPLANYRITGKSSKVMIHNGHWGRWEEVRKILNSEGLLPDGPWSDSRLAAYLAHEDPEWLTALGGRVAVMDGDGKIVRLGDWKELRSGIHVSNDHWQTTQVTRGGYAGWRMWPGWDDDAENKEFAEAIAEASAKKQGEREESAKADTDKSHGGPAGIAGN